MSPVEGSLEDRPKLDSGQIIETILRESPSVKRAQEAVARAEAQLRSARREAVPDLQLRAGLQQNRQLLEQARMTDDVTSPSAAMVSILE